jgi:hypothetical protein
MAKMTWTAQPSLNALFIGACLIFTAMPARAAAPERLCILPMVDDVGPDREGRQDAPGERQQGRDLDGSSEDGTDDEADQARPGPSVPEMVPGCRFRDGPLELVV